MPTELIPIGMPTTLLQNVVYALPAVAVNLYSDTATPTLVVSNAFGFATSTPLTLTAGVANGIGGSFIKSTAGNAVVLLKRA